ncbi:MAG: replication initiator protein A [Tyzzerella sp.]|nr:replication initiator protein A [Tyzzerella sp.]
MEFNYYYGTEADQFSFIRIPKALLLDKNFATLSLQAKMLYGILHLKFRKIWDFLKRKQLNT